MMRFSSICSSLLFSSCWLISESAIAQVTPDGSLSTTVDSAEAQFTINNGDRAGDNLFHSFQDFSVPNNGSANFNNAADIVNIFSRVTGGNISQIDGAIGANGSANLLLINPAGIVFGENATLNIGGSFLATTAESLLFPEGEFNAADTQSQPLLTINRPIGLGFGSNPGSIINRSGNLSDPADPPKGLEVQPGKNLTLVGGEIWLDGGYLSAVGGKIELGSVAEATQVEFVPTDGDVLQYETETNFGDIRLFNLSRINASGLGGGAIRLQGKNIILAGGSKISSNTFGDRPGENITIKATDSLQILGTTNLPNLFEPLEARFEIIVPLRSSITSISTGAGDAGDIAIDTRQLILENGGRITASTFLSSVSDDPIESGEGGSITIDAENVAVTGVATVGEGGIDLFNLGRLGIEINGVSSIGTVSGNAAKAGNITIDTNKLTISNGAVITTNSFATGGGGNLVISATESIEVSGSSPSGIVNSVIVSSSATTGASGDIRINTDRLTLQNEGQINARTGTGRAGNIEIDLKNLLLDNGTLTAATQAGDRGNINVINSDTIFLRNGSNITTNATELSTGGDINLNSGAIAIDNSSNITAIAEAGQGGNIQIYSQGLFLEPNAEITAASNLGIDGTIIINDPDVDPASSIIELPTSTIDVESILAQDVCKVENENIAGGSSFIVTGRGGLTPTSADPLNNLNVVNWTDESGEVSNDKVVTLKRSPSTSKHRSIVRSQGFAVAADGSLWLSSNSPKAVPQSSPTHPNCQALLNDPDLN